MRFEIVTIAGIESLASFSRSIFHSLDCLDLDLVMAEKSGGIVELYSTIPHGLANQSPEEPISQDCKNAAITTLNQWINDGLLKPMAKIPEWLFYYEYKGMGNVTVLDPAQAVPISSVDLVDAYFRNLSLPGIGKAYRTPWMTDRQYADFLNRCIAFKQGKLPPALWPNTFLEAQTAETLI